jgi:hypothetical protein
LKLHKGRVISADDVDSRLKPTGISREWYPAKGQ